MVKDRTLEELEELYDNIYVTPISDCADLYSYPMRQFVKMLDTVRDNRDIYNSLLSYCDTALSDLYHFRELNTMNAVELSKFNKILHELLIKRRYVKNNLALLQVIDNTLASLPTNLKGSIKNLADNLDNWDMPGFRPTTHITDGIKGNQGE